MNPRSALRDVDHQGGEGIFAQDEFARADLTRTLTWAKFFTETEVYAMTGAVRFALSRTPDSTTGGGSIDRAKHEVKSVRAGQMKPLMAEAARHPNNVDSRDLAEKIAKLQVA